MQTQILILSYLHDKPWLHYCLRSIQKFARGFSGTTVVVPTDEASEFASMVAGFGMKLVTYQRDPRRSHWHLDAQCQKCHADEYCPNADFVLHTDSDCIFSEPVTPEDYFLDGKPVMVIEDYKRMPSSPWKPVTERIMGRPVQFEFMRRHPQVNPVGVYRHMREFLSQLHRMPFDLLVLSQKPDFPWGWTEHNIIGAFAYYTPAWHEKYEWWEVPKRPVPHEKLSQFWSLGPIDKEQPLPHTGGRGIPMAEFQRLGL